jgi:RAT1-interacting protein
MTICEGNNVSPVPFPRQMLICRFIEENHPAQYAKKQQQNQRPPNNPGGPSQDMMSYWGMSLSKDTSADCVGYKFETLALIPDEWDAVSREFIDNRDQHVVDNIEQYCSVVQTGIGNTTLILGGEVDAGKR